MSFDSAQLDAFEAVARLGSFSLAAEELHLTQPALSRRIQALERDLEQTVFARGPGGVELTTAGERLLEYAQTRQALEGELRGEMVAGRGRLAGTVRIAGYSTLLLDTVLPVLTPLMRSNPDVQVHLHATQGIRPYDRAPHLLLRAEIDFLIGAYTPPDRPDLVSVPLGNQELVAIESTQYETRPNTFLDTRPEDTSTDVFFAAQKGPAPVYQRSFLHDEAGLFEGVAQGLGRAVVIRSLIPRGAPIRVVPELKPLRWQVSLIYRKQRYTPKLLLETRELLKIGCPPRLR